MESNGAKKYAVTEMTTNIDLLSSKRRRSSVLLDKFTERKLSWMKAMEKANTMLQEERQDANEKNSKNKYFGYSKFSKRKMQVALAPSCCDQFLQTVTLLSLAALQFYVHYILGFGLLYSFGTCLCYINLYIKTITTGNNFRKDDAAPFQILRMMDEKDRTFTLKKMDMPLGLAENKMEERFVTMYFFLNALSVVTIYVLMFDGIISYNHVAYSFFWVLNFLLHSPCFPVGMGIESDYFFHLTKAFTKMINEDFVIWEVEGNGSERLYDMTNDTDAIDLENGNGRKRVNFEQAYENFHILIDLVEQYSSCFAGYFFYAEFTLLLATVFLGVGTGDNVFNLIRNGFTMTGMMRVIGSTGFFFLYIHVCKIVFSAAASITKAISNLKYRAHKLDAVISVIDPSSMDKSKKFYDHVCEGIKLSGFRSMGIIISNSLGAKVAYGALTLISTVAMVAMKYVEL